MYYPPIRADASVDTLRAFWALGGRVARASAARRRGGPPWVPAKPVPHAFHAQCKLFFEILDMAEENDGNRLLPEVAGLNATLIDGGLQMSETARNRLRTRAAIVNALETHSIPDLLKMAKPPGPNELDTLPKKEFRLRVHATLLKYGIGEELSVKVGNELLLQTFISATAHLIPPEYHEDWMGGLYKALRGVA